MFRAEIDGFDYANGEISKLLNFVGKNMESLSAMREAKQQLRLEFYFKPIFQSISSVVEMKVPLQTNPFSWKP